MSNFDHIFKSFNLGEGGSLFDVDPAEMTPNTNFVFISLGGMGLVTLSHIKTKIARECSLERAGIVQYLAIDTDADLINMYQQAHRDFEPLTDDEYVLLQCNIPQQALTLPQRHNLSPYIKEWLNPNLNHRVDQHGASGIRQVGRFFFSWSDNHANVLNALRRIRYNLSPGYALQVYLISSLAGGTGSGGFIDLGYLVRDVFEIHGNHPNNMLKAFLYLPDTRELWNRPVDQAHQYRNGCAALKELEYFMNLSNARKGVTQNPNVDLSAHYHYVYPYVYPDGDEVTSTDNIFDQCTLISGADVDGRDVRVEDATSMEVACSIVSQVTLHRDPNGIGVFNVLLGHLVAAPPVPTVQNAGYAELYPLNANFCYMACGYSEMRLPLQECYAFATDMIFRSVNQLYLGEIDHFIHTNGEDADQVMENCGFRNLRAMEQKIAAGREFTSVKVGSVSRPVLPQLAKQLEQDPNLFDLEWDRFEKALEASVSVDEIVAAYFDALKNALEQNFNANPFRTIIFTDFRMDGRLHPRCLVAQFYELESEIANEIEGLSEKVDQKYREYDTARSTYCYAMFKVMHRGPLFEAAEETYNAIYHKFIKEKLLEAVDKILSNLLSEYAKYFHVYTTVLQNMQDVLAENKAYLVNADIRANSAFGLFTYDPAPLYCVTDPVGEADERHRRLIHYIESVVASVDASRYARGFMQMLQSRRDMWTELLEADKRVWNNQGARNAENADVTINMLVNSIRAFFNANRSLLGQFTLENYLVTVYQKDGDTAAEALNRAAQDICHRLELQSKPIYTTGYRYDLNQQLGELSLRALCVPGNAAQLYNAISNLPEVQNAFANGRLHLYHSSSSDTVSMHQIYSSLPAYILRQLEKMEIEYDRAIVRGDCGFHMEENPESPRVWRDFPMSLVREMWMRTENPAAIPITHENRMRDRVHNCVERIKDLGILQVQDDPFNDRRLYSAEIPEVLVRPGFEQTGRLLTGEDRFPKFDREDFISKVYGRLSETAEEVYDTSYGKLLSYFRPDDGVITVYFNQTFAAFVLQDDTDFELDLRGNPERLVMLESLLRLYDYAMEPVRIVSQ